MAGFGGKPLRGSLAASKACTLLSTVAFASARFFSLLRAAPVLVRRRPIAPERPGVLALMGFSTFGCF
jgi:hypothetical protein